MGVCTTGLKVWNKGGYGRREYVQREMYNLKLNISCKFDISCMEINIACTVIRFNSGIETYCKTYLVYYIILIIVVFWFLLFSWRDSTIVDAIWLEIILIYQKTRNLVVLTLSIETASRKLNSNKITKATHKVLMIEPLLMILSRKICLCFETLKT